MVWGWVPSTDRSECNSFTWYRDYFAWAVRDYLAGQPQVLRIPQRAPSHQIIEPTDARSLDPRSHEVKGGWNGLMMANRLAQWMASDLSGPGGAPMRSPLCVLPSNLENRYNFCQGFIRGISGSTAC